MNYFSTLAVCLTGVTLSLAQTPTRSLSSQQETFITFPDAPPNLSNGPAKEITRVPVADGYFVFVKMLQGDVAIIAEGKQAFDVLRHATAQQSATALKIYVAAGGDPKTAPGALITDDSRQQSGQPHTPAWLNLRPSPSAVPSVQGASDLGVIGNSCISGSTPTYVWNNGPANLNLGSTSAGAAVVCFPQDESDAYNARITVQEYYGNGLWIDLFTNPYVYEGTTYGYWFKGLVVHKIRVLIRDERPAGDQNPPIGPFYWGGAY